MPLYEKHSQQLFLIQLKKKSADIYQPDVWSIKVYGPIWCVCLQHFLEHRLNITCKHSVNRVKRCIPLLYSDRILAPVLQKSVPAMLSVLVSRPTMRQRPSFAIWSLKCTCNKAV
ncbi:hypothetical protein GDO78_008685 [Eleutherodactylus coqui]|uniref:Uncharacterized protein n=1 Tax=Eleutherodactylus coqui TaxID=57060 RepID=A0A8J6FDY5_ELECQ|nr:hypothetical protein GDO78_008685 [Eleutherodactylus coqui]